MASIASLVLGYTAAHTTSARFASYLPGEPEVQRMLAMGVVYIAVSGGIFGIAWMVRGTLRKLRFEAYDRHLGMLLGGLEGVGVGMLATMFVVSVAPATRQPIFSSSTGRMVGTVMNNLGPVLPGEVRKVLAPHWDGSLSQVVADHEAREDAGGTDSAAGNLDGAAASSQLPELHEADAAGDSSAVSALPALPALEPAGVEDRAVERTRRSHRSDAPPALDGPQNEAGLDGILEKGRQEVEQAVSGTIDRQLQRLGGLKSATPKGQE
jgi:membrane protein required for colicin V production